MPGYLGVQLSLELTRLLPSSLVSASVTQIVNFARQLRSSGSDIVVEEDLAAIFGRGRISPELESKFKKTVNVQTFTPLCKGSDVDLADGVGPTMLRAFQERRYFATVVTLSMLGYFYVPTMLARMISKAISVRFEANIAGSTEDPGFEGILKTLMACSSQSSAFHWHIYRESVEEQLWKGIPNYCFHIAYIWLSSAIITGAMDFLYLAQSLLEDRKITIPDQTRCISLIIWAHYILGLSVIIRGTNEIQVIFGNPEEA
ncbi:hypothetical protein BDW74DRAFT_179577 [Aspergillus multicolor]|uniref:uncharacterized protein n=1 Tax=Aspergillus multicolor TaxID=41759 RepID=UPI003CCE409D